MKTFCKKSTLWRSLILEWSYKQSKWSYKQTNSSKHAISVIFIIWSNYDYHFIIKELAEEFEGQVTCLGEHTEKYITFSVLIEKEVLFNMENKYQKPYPADENYPTDGKLMVQPCY